MTAPCVVEGAARDTEAWAMAFGPLDLTTGRPYAHGPIVDPVVRGRATPLTMRSGRRGPDMTRRR